MTRASSRRQPRVGVSACLLGEQVRYDGGHKREPSLVEAFGGQVEWVQVCPEVEVGMGVPREPILLVAAADGVASGSERARLLGSGSRQDWTARMDAWARARVAWLATLNLAGFVLKSRSPSCGPWGVPIHEHEEHDAGAPAGGQSGSGPAAPSARRFVPTMTGRGLFAQALLDGIPGLPVEDEERLRDATVRQDFLVRILTYYAGRPG